MTAVLLGGLATAVIRDGDQFAELAEPWERLAAGCRSATPFQAHAWLTAWWRAYGRTGRMRVVVVRSGGELVAAAPLYLSHRLGVRVLLPLAVGVSDFGDILLADDLGAGRAEILGVLAGALKDVRGWDVIDLPEVRPEAAAMELAGQWAGWRSCTAASTCLELRTADLSDVVTALPELNANGRRKLRQRLGKLDRVGLVSREVPAEQVPVAVAEFHRLHLAQWEGRGINPEHARARFPAFLAEALPTMVDRGQAVVTEYRLDQELVAVVINLVTPSLLGGYLCGVLPSLRQHVDVGTLLLRDDMQRALQRRTPVVSMLRGQEDYKSRWRALPVQSRRLVLGRATSVRALLYVAAAEGRAKVLPWLRTHTGLKDLLQRSLRRLPPH